jgi:RNA polymerase sigma-70 factor, ECF subfamily
MNQFDVFNQHRPLLFSVAYRMLGSRADAEDLLQESYLRWSSVQFETIASPKAYLVTMVTRMAIDQLRACQVKREEYVGSWLPEPMLEQQVEEPAELAESLSMAFLILLERLSPVERAAFILREIFDYGYEEIAEIVGKSSSNCRQIVVRARKHVRDQRPRFEVAKQEHETIVRRFLAACSKGDLPSLLSMLKQDIVLYSDGGGKARSALNPIRGADRVARFLAGVTAKAPAGLLVRLRRINAQPGVVLLVDKSVFGVLVLSITDEIIQEVYLVSNPDKLSELQANMTD